MSTPKIRWRVHPAPPRCVCSVAHWAWPCARYTTERKEFAAALYCSDSYSPALARSGEHQPIKVCVVDYARLPWVWRVVGASATLAEAKALVGKTLKEHPEYAPDAPRRALDEYDKALSTLEFCSATLDFRIAPVKVVREDGVECFAVGALPAASREGGVQPDGQFYLQWFAADSGVPIRAVLVRTRIKRWVSTEGFDMMAHRRTFSNLSMDFRSETLKVKCVDGGECLAVARLPAILRDGAMVPDVQCAVEWFAANSGAPLRVALVELEYYR